MSNPNIRKFFSDIQETFSKGFKSFDENTHEQIKMDIELLQMILEQVKVLRSKKEAIMQLQNSINSKNQLIAEFAELVTAIIEQFRVLSSENVENNCYLYSPYNNTKPLTSSKIINFAKKISHSLQAPKNYVPDSLLPSNFVLPFPTEDNFFHSYIYFNSRTDGKEPQKCQTPHFGITNKIDILIEKETTFHMKRPATVVITANDPKDCEITFTMDGTLPTPFSAERRMTNGESLDVRETCTLKIMACKYGFIDSDILELHFIIDRDGGFINQAAKADINQEYAQRPDFLAETKITGIIDFLDTPHSVGRTPSHSFTPSYTPSYYRESSTREPNDH